MDNEKIMIELEQEVKDLAKDVGTVKQDMGTVKGDVREILNILSGNPKVTGDRGITGRILDTENRVEDIEEWKLKKADYVVEDYRLTKDRVAAIEKQQDKQKLFSRPTAYILGAIGGAILTKLLTWLFS
ncbi:MAG: hypothetical protein ACTHMM_10150 [Agriterribacter sp.]